MQHRQNNANSSSSSRQSVLDPEDYYSSNENSRGAVSRQRVDEARQLLDEIAITSGLDPEGIYTGRRHFNLAKAVKRFVLLPVSLLLLCLKLALMPLKRADLALLKEMGKFLSHPGHFFWFNRLAPQAASRHFRTSSTDAMTHHVRRFGAHLAMIAMALTVVVFGGFSGLTKAIISPEAMAAPDGGTAMGTLAQLGNMHEMFITGVNSGTLEPRRTKIYQVVQGDSLKGLSEKFGVSLNTLLFANLLIDPDTDLILGQKLIVPPTTGMLHIANQGDTIAKLADMYQVDPLSIINYPLNNLAGSDLKTQLLIGQEVIVPNGVMPMRDKLYVYTTHPGDTIKSVAEKFGINSYTLRTANDLEENEVLESGTELDILPINGIQYTTRPGDTLQSIAIRYSVPVESILNYSPNSVARGLKLEVNRTILIPDGIMPYLPPPVKVAPSPVQIITQPNSKPVIGPVVPTAAPKPVLRSNVAANPNPPAANLQNKAPAINASQQNNKPQAAAPAAPKAAANIQSKPAAQAKAANNSKPAAAPAAPVAAKPAAVAPKPASSGGYATGSMIWPMPGIITTYFGQPIWYGIHMGLDIATTCGTPEIAADGGTVIEAGWSQYGYGINVQINHGNGIVTRYGHMSVLKAYVGERVSKGQVIGLEGTTGNSSGCHLHFEVKVNGTYTDPLRWIRR